MILLLDKIEERAKELGGSMKDLKSLAGLTETEVYKASLYAFGEPETVGKLCAYLGLTPRMITKQKDPKKRDPLPWSAQINGYIVECLMAKEDLSYEDIKEKVGFDIYGAVRVNKISYEKAVILADALYVKPEDIIMVMPKEESAPAATGNALNGLNTATV